MSQNIIICAKREDPFARVPKTALADARLSWRAKGLLAYLLGKPAGWKVRRSDLEKQSTDGARSVRAGLDELRASGYAELVPLRSGNRITEWVWKVSDSCIFAPHKRGDRFKCSQDERFAQVQSEDVQNAHNSKKEHSKHDYSKPETKESCAVPSQAPKEEYESAWKPNPDGKQKQLNQIPTPKSSEFPSQTEFEDFCAANDLSDVFDSMRPDLYSDLCRMKWHQWRSESNRWVRIRDWKRYVIALGEHLMAFS